MQATQLRNVRCAGLVFLPALGGHTGHGRHGNTLLATIISNRVSWHKDMGGHNKCRDFFLYSVYWNVQVSKQHEQQHSFQE